LGEGNLGGTYSGGGGGDQKLRGVVGESPRVDDGGATGVGTGEERWSWRMSFMFTTLGSLEIKKQNAENGAGPRTKDALG